MHRASSLSIAWPCSSSAWAITGRRCRYALGVCDDDAPLSALALPDLVEAATRCGETGVAEAALGRLAERALAADTPLALGLLARSRALLAADADAEPLYQEAIEYLGKCQAAPQLARAHLVHGEWLRRQRRRRDAREELRTAHEMFDPWAPRPLPNGPGSSCWPPANAPASETAETETELTPQEAQIARLVSQGDSNRDIAAQLFLSPSTVDYHLRKVYRKTRRGIPHPARAHHGRRSLVNRRLWSDNTSGKIAVPATCNAPAARVCDPTEMPLRCLIVDDNAYFLEAAATSSSGRA